MFFTKNMNNVEEFLEICSSHSLNDTSILGRATRLANQSYTIQPPMAAISDEFIIPERYTTISGLFTFGIVLQMSVDESSTRGHWAKAGSHRLVAWALQAVNVTDLIDGSTDHACCLSQPPMPHQCRAFKVACKFWVMHILHASVAWAPFSSSASRSRSSKDWDP